MTSQLKTNISVSFNAPLSFVFQWCTNFTECDNQIYGSSKQRKNIEKIDQRVTYSDEIVKENGDLIRFNSIVNMFPPNRWNLELTCDDMDEIGEYLLTTQDDKTILEMTFKLTYKIEKIPTTEKIEQYQNKAWTKFKVALEKDYLYELQK